MAAFNWMGQLREPARAALFRVFRQAFTTDDGKRILGDTLAGLTLPAAPLGSLAAARDVYPDLPGPIEPAAKHPPVFITARFRSGSTLLWNLFRHVPDCRSYYEPLNERRWFDPATRGDRTDPTHVGVADYWHEYEGLEILAQWYRDEWISRRLQMQAHDHDPALETYIATLVGRAPGRAVLQFNRVDFRLPWLRRHFAGARIIHLYRHPRDQWCSTLASPDEFPPDGRTDAFAPHDHYYLLSWARDLSYHFPFLDPRTADHPYVLFYYLWRLSHAFGQRDADASFSFETLCESPRREVPRLMAAAGIDDYNLPSLERLISPPRPGRWTAYAGADWFDAHESHCEAVLARGA